MNPIRRRCRAVTLFTPLALAGAMAAIGAEGPSAPLSLDARVRCLESIEHVYWQHRSGDSATSFAQALPQALLRRRAEDLELKAVALDELWQVRVSPQQVQAELDRMAAHSQSPARLRELFAALGDDPALAAECLARPVLVDRLLRAEYARDERLHGATESAKRPFETWWNETRTQLTPEPGAADFAYRLPLIAARRHRLYRRQLDADAATARPALLAHGGVDRQRDDRLRRHEQRGHHLRRW